MPGVLATPAALCAKQKAHKQVTTGIAIALAFPARMVLTVSFALFLVNRAYLPPSPCGSSPQDLTPASGRQNHTTSPSACRLTRQLKRKRPSHPALTLVTIARRPLGERETRESMHLICPTR